MPQVLLLLLGIYLVACYAYGVFTLVRLLTARKVVRPTSRREPTELARAAMAELDRDPAYADKQRVAA